MILEIILLNKWFNTNLQVKNTLFPKYLIVTHLDQHLIRDNLKVPGIYLKEQVENGKPREACRQVENELMELKVIKYQPAVCHEIHNKHHVCDRIYSKEELIVILLLGRLQRYFQSFSHRAKLQILLQKRKWCFCQNGGELVMDSHYPEKVIQNFNHFFFVLIEFSTSSEVLSLIEGFL